MAVRKHFITAESVAEGHPDKVCDQISDAVLDEVIRQDPNGRVACETYVTMGLLIVGGEITTSGYVDVHNLVRNVLKDIGYTHPKYGFDYHTCAIVNTIHNQSPDIAQGVDRGGAGDQGIMVGYACRETSEFMPLPIMLAHKLVSRMAEVRKKGILKYLGPDGKSQVTIEYHDGHPKRIDSCILACQHTEEILDRTGKRITKASRQELIEVIAKPVLKEYIDKDTKYYVNETGKFVIGGPQSDTGMTGRKIIADNYGSIVAPGGGAFSGKDPTKVDRSAAYMARYIAKNLVAAGLADKCLVSIAYVIGRPEPVAINVETFGTGKVSDSAFIKLIQQNFDLTPKGMINTLNLLRPIYQKTACYGHFGREEPEFTWERTDKIKELQKSL
ncbi:MAG: methionine adenosyltransferase [Candidatus Omnitrophica bacterium]|nr:methionine adenosyltransferase [Candidatus Omnitrophota bacterium]